MAIKIGHPAQVEKKKEIIYMVDVLDKNFTQVGKDLKMSKQLVRHHYITGKKLSTEKALDKRK